MPSTYLSLHYHIVFSTKNREPYIDSSWSARLHDYLGGTIRKLGGFPQGVGGMPDHIHMLIGLKATHCLADVMRELKKSSSTWVHNEIRFQPFGWQDGYAAFTVGPTSRDSVKGYIADQANHHRVKTFRDELIELLELSGIEYDPKYLD